MAADKLAAHRNERGVVLVVVLVMLGIFMLIVVSVVGSSNINFKIAGNQQYRMESRLAAQHGIEMYISNPANFQIPIPTTASDIGIDFTGDGADNYIAVVQPPICLRDSPLLLADLDFDVAADAPCFGSGAAQQTGLLGDGGSGTGGTSWCAEMAWNVQSRVADVATGARATFHQGVAMRAIIGTTCP